MGKLGRVVNLCIAFPSMEAGSEQIHAGPTFWVYPVSGGAGVGWERGACSELVATLWKELRPRAGAAAPSGVQVALARTGGAAWRQRDSGPSTPVERGSCRKLGSLRLPHTDSEGIIDFP